MRNIRFHKPKLANNYLLFLRYSLDYNIFCESRQIRNFLLYPRSRDNEVNEDENYAESFRLFARPFVSRVHSIFGCHNVYRMCVGSASAVRARQSASIEHHMLYICNKCAFSVHVLLKVKFEVVKSLFRLVNITHADRTSALDFFFCLHLNYKWLSTSYTRAKRVNNMYLRLIK